MNDTARDPAVGLRRMAACVVMVVAAVLVGPAAAQAQTPPPITVQFSSNNYTINEGGGAATITVTLSAASTQTVTVDYATSDGTATAPTDYTSASGTLTFAPGVTSQTFSVSVANDTSAEFNENVNLTLSNPTNATLGDPYYAELVILDDDTTPIVQFSTVSYTVGESAGSAVITVSLFGTTNQTVTVDYATSDGTATAPSDYTATSGTLTFAPGVTSQTFSIPIVNDSVVESDETVNLTLSNPSNATLGISTATLTIEDDDGPTSYSVSVTVTTSDLGPLGISEQGQAPLTADATLSISGSPPSSPLTGPIWSWVVVSVDYSSDGVTYVPSPGGDHTSIDQPDNTVADATLIASFDTAGFWQVTVQATATYYTNGGGEPRSHQTTGTAW